MSEPGLFTTTHVLVAAAQAGETAAFQALLERYFFVGNTWLERKTLPAAVSTGDILGDVFRDFLARPEILRKFELREAGSFRRFFFTVLKNRFLYAHRRSAHEREALEALTRDTVRESADPDEEENAIWRMNLVRRALAEWSRCSRSEPARKPAAVLFREMYLDGKRLKDAAAAAGLTLDQAKKLHGRGKREIKELILELIRLEVADDAHYFDEIRCLFPLGEAPDPASCPSEERLRDFLAGALPERDREAAAAHLGSCPFCRPRLRAFERER